MIIGGSRGALPACAPPPPNRNNFFVFTYVFAKKCTHRRSAPPTGWRPPPTGNPGSATDDVKSIIKILNTCRSVTLARTTILFWWEIGVAKWKYYSLSQLTNVQYSPCNGRLQLVSPNKLLIKELFSITALTIKFRVGIYSSLLCKCITRCLMCCRFPMLQYLP